MTEVEIQEYVANGQIQGPTFHSTRTGSLTASSDVKTHLMKVNDHLSS
jgi:hypothetical protein